MKAVLLIHLIVLCAIAPAVAQQTSPLTLDRAVAIAIEKNTSVVQARNSYEASQSASLAAVGGLLPSVDASGNFNRNQQWKSKPGYTIQGDQIVPNSGFAASNNYSLGVRGQMTVFDGFANTSNVSRAHSNEASSKYTLSRTEQSVTYQTHVLFMNVVRTSQLLDVSIDNLKRSKQQLERIVESNKVGAVALADVYREQVQVGNDEISRIQAVNNLENAKADLVAFLGIPADKQYDFDFTGVPQDIDTTEFGPLNARYGDVATLGATALKTRPDYLAAMENSNSADASVTVARAGHLPTISASSSYGYSGYDTPAGSSPLFQTRGLSLGLSFSLPIFSGFAIQNQVEQAQVTHRNAVEQQQQTERQVYVDIRKALLDLEAAEKQVTVAQTTVTSAKMDLEIAQEKYNLGAGTLLDLLVATANYSNAMSNKVNAVTGYNLAKKQVEFVLGTISQ